MKISGKHFDPAPPYNGRAVCVDVTALKKRETEWGERESFRIVFELDAEREDGTRWAVWSKPFSPSLHEKASLRAFLKQWFGRDLKADELKEFDTETLIGRGAEIVVVHETGTKGETFANIAACLPPRGETLKAQGSFVREKDRKEGGPGGGPKEGGTGAAYKRTAAGPPAEDHSATVVHVGNAKGLPLGELPAEAVAKLVENWLGKVFPAIAKPTADDKRLAAALTVYRDAPPEPEPEPVADY